MFWLVNTFLVVKLKKNKKNATLSCTQFTQRY